MSADKESVKVRMPLFILLAKQMIVALRKAEKKFDELEAGQATEEEYHLFHAAEQLRIAQYLSQVPVVELLEALQDILDGKEPNYRAVWDAHEGKVFEIERPQDEE